MEEKKKKVVRPVFRHFENPRKVGERVVDYTDERVKPVEDKVAELEKKMQLAGIDDVLKKYNGKRNLLRIIEKLQKPIWYVSGAAVLFLALIASSAFFYIRSRTSEQVLQRLETAVVKVREENKKELAGLNERVEQRFVDERGKSQEGFNEARTSMERYVKSVVSAEEVRIKGSIDEAKTEITGQIQNQYTRFQEQLKELSDLIAGSIKSLRVDVNKSLDASNENLRYLGSLEAKLKEINTGLEKASLDMASLRKGYDEFRTSYDEFRTSYDEFIKGYAGDRKKLDEFGEKIKALEDSYSRLEKMSEKKEND